MVMVGHSKRQSEPLRFTRAGRLGVMVVSFCLFAAAVAGVVIALNTSPVRPGCISITSASTVGGAVTNACGAKAREICAHPAENPALSAHRKLEAACRRARLPYDLAAAAPTARL